MSRSPRNSDFFIAGGTLRPNTPSYIKRPADDELFNLALAGEFCYVLSARQMGKSSLMIRTAQRLRAEGIQTAIIDLTEIGLVSIDAWYLGLLTELSRALRLSVNPEAWWREHSALGHVHRFTNFLRDVVLVEKKEQIAIFIDEIDTTLNFNFRDDFFAAIRAMYNNRARDAAFNRLTFILLGVASPTDLIKDRTRTPFNIGQGITLPDFDSADAAVLQTGLEQAHPGQGETTFNHIFYWTNGHPYLTQKLCQEVVGADQRQWTKEQIDKLVERKFLSEEAKKETNLQFVQDMVLSHPRRGQLLTLYRSVYQGAAIRENEQSPLQNQLKLAGLVKAENGYLQIRNELYRRAFNLSWVKENTPPNKVYWAYGVACASFLVAALVIGLVVITGGGLVVHGYWVRSQVNEATTNFYQADTSDERLQEIARVLQARSMSLSGVSDYVYEARDLFYSLSWEEQLALFKASNPNNEDLVVVIQGLYTTLAHIDNTDQTTELLAAMQTALEKLDETDDVKKLKTEISSWLQARTSVQQANYARARDQYNQAITINGENPATMYERAAVLIQLPIPAYQQAGSDLNQVIAIAPQAPDTNITATLSSSNTPVTPTLTQTPFLPPPAPPGLTSTVTPINLTPATATPEATASTSTATPTITPTPSRFISQFSTPGDIRRAVSNLISSNPGLADYLANISDNPYPYPNLEEVGLRPPTQTPTSTQEPATPTLTPAAIATDAVIAGTNTSTSTPTSTPTSSCDDSLGCVVVARGDPIRLASALVIAGPNQTLGIDAQRGIEIAMADWGEIADHPLELQAEDDGCSAESGRNAALKIAADSRIVAVIGHSCSSSCVPAAPIYNDVGLTMVSPSCTAPSLTAPDSHVPSFLRTSFNDREQGRVMAEYMYNELNLRTAATINDGSPYAEQLQQFFADTFSALGGEITAQEAINVGDTDMRPVLSSIAAGEPDLLYYPVFIAEGAFITTQAKETAGLENTVLAGADGLISPDFIAAAGEAAEGMYISGPDLGFTGEKYNQFLVEHEARYSEQPLSAFHAHAYDATTMVLSAIENVAQTDAQGNLIIGRQALRNALYATQNFDGITGQLTCSQNGDCWATKIMISRIENGQYVPILSAGRNQ